MALERALLIADVAHRRVIPKPHALAYRVYYVCLPLQALAAAANRIFSINRRNLFSFHEKNHGFGNDGCEAWARHVLADYGLAEACNGSIELLTMPRLFGYGFNPVSFWFCRDGAGALRSVIAEVNNTFGERHCYLLAHADASVITDQQWLDTKKLFHVSPFLEVRGSYRFRFHDGDERLAVWIDYFDDAGALVLNTSLVGTRSPLSARSMLACFFRYPLVTFKVIGMIHVHALRMVAKGFRYHRKPPLTAPEVSR
jgi:hypothetical protein